MNRKPNCVALSILMFLLITLHQSATAAEKMTVLLDWFINPDHAPLFVAKERGYFTQKGLEVSFIAPSNPNDPPKFVAAGKADIAVSYQHSHYLHVARGLPLIRFATLIATPLNSLVVLEEGPIKTIADLKGKTVGYSIGGFETVLLKVMLEKHGLNLTDIKLVNVNFALSPSLFSGKTDAVIGAFRNFELNQMDLESRPGKAFYVEEHGIPSYDELILVAHADQVHQEKYFRFVKALELGVQYLINHPEESWELFIKGRKELDNDLNKLAWQDTLSRFALRPGALDRNRYETFSAFLKKEGMLKKDLPLSTIATELR